MSTEIDVVLADIIQDYMGLDGDRVVIYDQNFKAPKDNEIYIVISTGLSTIIGNVNRLDTDTEQEVQKISMSTEFIIEITSQDDSAKLRVHEVVMAINSNNAQNKANENNFRIYRTKTIQDLSFIEGRSSLHRYRIPVIITYVKTEKRDTVVYDNFQNPEVI